MVERLLVVRWVVGLIPHSGPTELCGMVHIKEPQTFTFNMRPKSRVVVGTVRVWSLSGLTLWLASWANAYRAFPTIAGDSVPQARTSVAARGNL